MSWRKSQYEDAYNRAEHRLEECEGYEDYVDECVDPFDYWHNENMYEDDGFQPSMKDLAIGRLLTILSKLKVRGSSRLLDNWWW